MKAVRFKTFMRERAEFSVSGDETLLSVSEYFGVKPRAEVYADEPFESRSVSLEGYRRVYPDDFVMNYMLAWKGAYGIAKDDGIVSPSYAVFHVDQSKVYPRFLHYRLRSRDMHVLFRRYSKGIIESRLRLYPETFLSLSTVLPDLSRQQRIADFLDRETARIDELIEKKERLVSLLKRRILSTVETMFTELRDEGIQPRKLAYYVTKVGSGKTPRGGASVYSHSGVRFIRSQNVHNDGFRLDDIALIPFEVDEEMAGTRVHLNDVLLNITGASIGRCAVATEEVLPANVNQHVCIIRPSSKIEPNFLRLAILSDEVQSQIHLASFSANREGLNFEQIRNLLIRVPGDINAQRRLVVRVQRAMANIYRAVDKVERSIAKLHELRNALITAAVTGQIDVDGRDLSEPIGDGGDGCESLATMGEKSDKLNTGEG